MLNLGVEGMMLVGAAMGFFVVQRLDGPGPSRCCGDRRGRARRRGDRGIHAFLVITLRANQIVSGLAITIFAGAAGLSSYLANDLNLAESPARHSFARSCRTGLVDLPVVGPILFAQTAARLRVVGVLALVALYLARTRRA